MPYAEWREKHQTEASPEKRGEFEARRPKDHGEPDQDDRQGEESSLEKR